MQGMQTNLRFSAKLFTRRAPVVLMILATFCLNFPDAQAKPKPKGNSINLVPTVTGISLVDGQLVATGTATATIRGTTTTVPFTAPVTISGTFPVLDLSLGPIDLDLLGLV